METKIEVELIGIELIKFSNEFDVVKEFGELFPLLDFTPHIQHHPINQTKHFYSVLVNCMLVDNVYPKPLVSLISQSNFSITCPRKDIDVPLKDGALVIFSHLTDMAIAHSQALLYASTASTPAAKVIRYMNYPPPKIKEVVRKKMNQKGN